MRKRAKNLTDATLTPRLYHIPNRPNYADLPVGDSVDERVFRWICRMANANDRIRIDTELLGLIGAHEGLKVREVREAVHRLATISDVEFVGFLDGYFADLDEWGVAF